MIVALESLKSCACLVRDREVPTFITIAIIFAELLVEGMDGLEEY